MQLPVRPRKENSSSDEVVWPPWGSCAFDLFCLERWNLDRPYSDERRNIVDQWLQLGLQGRTPYAKQAREAPADPTTHQIESILRPFRTLQQRLLAQHPCRITSESYWLRTCYDPSLDSRRKQFGFNRIDPMMMFGDARYILDNPDEYDFGDDWMQIYHVMPEIPSPPAGSEFKKRPTKYSARRYGEPPSCLLSDFGMKLDVPRQNDITYLAKDIRDVETGEARARQLYNLAFGDEQRYHAFNYIFVEDREAQETGLVNLVHVDEQGREVRSLRMDAEQAHEVSGMYNEFDDYQFYWWANAKPGPVYSPGGERGYPLHCADALLVFVEDDPQSDEARPDYYTPPLDHGNNVSVRYTGQLD